MVRSSVMLICPLVNVIVPVKPSANTISSGPGFALASSTACRSEPGPLSARFTTVSVAAHPGDDAPHMETRTMGRCLVPPASQQQMTFHNRDAACCSFVFPGQRCIIIWSFLLELHRRVRTRERV